MSKNNKIQYSQPKSIIRYIWVRMRENNDTRLVDKKNTCIDVLSEAIENRFIQAHTGEYMINKIKSIRTIEGLDKYLINSKNYFEKNFVLMDR